MEGFLISLIGVDGSGKTTLAERLVEELDRKGYPVRYVWFRFPRFFALCLLLVSRLTGFTKYKNYGTYRYGIHYFSAMPFRLLYPGLVLADALVHYAIRVWIPTRLGYIVICDRWIYDIIIDLTIDTQNTNFFNSRFGHLFNEIACKANIVFLIDAPDPVLEARRPETRFDPTTAKRRFFYRCLAKISGVYTIDSSSDSKNTIDNLKNLLEHRTSINLETTGK